jgi:hypothetical protein
MLNPIRADLAVTDTPPSPTRQRTTISFLTANIHLGSGRALWPGVARRQLSEWRDRAGGRRLVGAISRANSGIICAAARAIAAV